MAESSKRAFLLAMDKMHLTADERGLLVKLWNKGTQMTRYKILTALERGDRDIILHEDE